MKHFARFVVKKKWLVLVVALLLAGLSVFGVIGTKINYDILTYLPKDLGSVIGEQHLDSDFNIASTAMVTVKNMNVIGVTLWVGILSALGFFFGNIEAVKNNFSAVLIMIIAVSVMPAVITYIRSILVKKTSPGQ